jgi:hypothetical protein
MGAMGRLFPLLFLLNMALVVVALIDCLSSDGADIRALPKVVWVFIILLFSPIGPIVWFVAGRPVRAVKSGKEAWKPGNGFPESSRPRQVAPDDDPEFLQGLAKSRREDEELLRRWEDDLRRREGELRDRDKPREGDADKP